MAALEVLALNTVIPQIQAPQVGDTYLFPRAAGFSAGTALLPSLAGPSDPDTGMWFPAANTVAWSTGGLEAMRTDSSQNVGIGTSSPVSRLHVDNGLITSRRYATSGAIVLQRADGTQSAPTAITSSGPVGVVVARGYDGSTYRDIGTLTFVSDGAVTNTSSPGYFAVTVTPAGSVTALERMRITSAGNVGIGTSSPSQKLDVIGQIRTTLGVTVDGGTTNNGAVAISTSNNQSLGGPSIYFLGSSNGTLFATSGTQQGTVNFYGPQYSGGCAITAFATENQNATSLGGELRIYTTPNGTTSQQERMRITSAGNVGIGTTSPAALLHVAGAGLFRATLAGTAATLPAESASLSVLNGAGYGTTPSVSFNIGANNWDAVNNNNTFQWSLTTLSPGAGAGLELNINSRSFDGTSTYTTTPRLTIGAAGNTAIGTTITSGARLTVRGSGTSSSTTGLLVEDSGGTDNLVIRDDGAYAFRGGTVGLAQTGYTTFTNLTTDRTCDADNTTVAELADILGTLIVDLKTKGIIAS